MLMVEQTLTCDICGAEMNNLKQFVNPGMQIQHISRPTEGGTTTWRDVCVDCQGPLMQSFWALKKAKAEEGRKK